MLSQVYVVDDDGGSRRAIREVLEPVNISVRTYQNAEMFLAEFDPKQPGCVLLDICMPGMSGLELQQRMNRDKLTIPVIMMTGHGSARSAVQAMKNGAFDFLEKPLNATELVDSVHSALRYDECQRRVQEHRQVFKQRVNTLTPREKQVMELVVSGLANKQIAAEIGVGQRTVEAHRNRVMHKMGAESLAALVKMSLTINCPYQNGASRLECVTGSTHCIPTIETHTPVA